MKKQQLTTSASPFKLGSLRLDNRQNVKNNQGTNYKKHQKKQSVNLNTSVNLATSLNLLTLEKYYNSKKTNGPPPISTSPKNGYKKYQPLLNQVIQHCVPTIKQTQTHNTAKNKTINVSPLSKLPILTHELSPYKNQKSNQLRSERAKESLKNQNKSKKFNQHFENNCPEQNLPKNNESFFHKFFNHVNTQQQQFRKSDLTLKSKTPLKNYNGSTSTSTETETFFKKKNIFKKMESLNNQYVQEKKKDEKIKSEIITQNIIYQHQQDFTKQNDLKLQDFQLGKCIGKGQYGKVHLAKHRKTNTIFALKEVSIKTIKEHQNIFNHFLLEIKILMYVDHPNILKCFGYFRSKESFYLILEYMEGGQLYNLIKKHKKLDQKQGGIYVRQVSEGVKYLHKNTISHRDIKPENIVIAFGLCKICDFGWATTSQQRRKTSCGTLDYIAPEIIQGLDYDCSIDLWCLGVLTYELLMGQTPFYHSSRKETMMRIINVNMNQSNISYDKLSQSSMSFIQGLLKKNPQQRLKIEEVLEHPFLKTEQQNVY